MSKPYIVVSDLHFHNFTAFSSTNEHGVNSRLQIQIDELKRAVTFLKSLGGDVVFNAGDTFHVRGKIETTVLNPVIDLFKWIENEGVKVFSIPGNHDLANRDTDRVGNAAQSLVGKMSFMASDVLKLSDYKVIMFPWHASVGALKEKLEKYADNEYTAIIHAPVNGVIMGIPDHGLDAKYLAGLGYNRVFAGHYHNHKHFGNGIYSIGAMCHQTWCDVGSKAGFIVVDGDSVKHIATHAPQFVDITSDNYDDADLLVDENYARVKIGVSKESDVEEVRKQILDWGAAGVVINQIRDLSPVSRTKSTVSTSSSMEESIEAFIKEKKYNNQDKLLSLCSEILDESEGEE